MQVAANITQLIGAIVTFLGLVHAYTRSAYGLGLWKWLESKARRRRVHHTASAHLDLNATGTLAADVYVPFALDTARPVEGQLAQLAEYVRELRALFPPVGQQIGRLDREIADARAYAEGVAAQALSEARKDTQRWQAEHDRTTVVDLRVAILGVAISVLGTALAFCG